MNKIGPWIQPTTILRCGLAFTAALLIILQVSKSLEVSNTSIDPSVTILHISPADLKIKDAVARRTAVRNVSESTVKLERLGNFGNNEKVANDKNTEGKLENTEAQQIQSTSDSQKGEKITSNLNKTRNLVPPTTTTAPQGKQKREKTPPPVEPFERTTATITPTNQSRVSSKVLIEGISTLKPEITVTPNNMAAGIATSDFFHPPPVNSRSIRRWGCVPRNETPFIFVHLGKAGGGSVRARIAAAALEYQRDAWHRRKNDSTYYYPIRDANNVLYKGKMVNSEMHSFLPLDDVDDKDNTFPFQRTFTFEGVLSCHATTPLGHAMACALEKDLCTPHRQAQLDKNGKSINKNSGNVSSARCDTVYMGHNVIGNEMHWLPTPFLLQWWNQSTWARNIYNNTNNGGSAQQEKAARAVAERLANRFKRSHRVLDATKRKRSRRFCKDGDLGKYSYMDQYQKCMKPDVAEVDRIALDAVYSETEDKKGIKRKREPYEQHWASFFASLPVLRVTMLREIFSWLHSRFFWQKWHLDKDGKGEFAPWRDEVEIHEIESHLRPPKLEYYRSLPRVRCDDVEQIVSGWGKQYALEFLVYFCGEHCMGQMRALNETFGHDEVKLQKEKAKHLKVMAKQAIYNLRNSFVVVGLLHQTNDFYDMITRRVDYMDTSLNPNVTGDRHYSGFAEEWTRCKNLFQEKDFQRKIIIASPEIAAAVRVYTVGEEVYEFQKREIKECERAE